VARWSLVITENINEVPISAKCLHFEALKKVFEQLSLQNQFNFSIRIKPPAKKQRLLAAANLNDDSIHFINNVFCKDFSLEIAMKCVIQSNSHGPNNGYEKVRLSNALCMTDPHFIHLRNFDSGHSHSSLLFPFPFTTRKSSRLEQTCHGIDAKQLIDHGSESIISHATSSGIIPLLSTACTSREE